ncbi:hypothetical protein F4703DRAFT_1931605 [Phycomyces blakesleeanus]
MPPSSSPAPMRERKSSNISKYLLASEMFVSGPNGKSLSWLLHMNRLKKGVGMTNEEAILVAATHFYGMAAKWWAIHEAKVTTWEVFLEGFKKQFASQQMEDVWWTEIDKTRQSMGQSIGEVALHLQELFGLVALANEAQKIWILLKALRLEITYEVEKSVPEFGHFSRQGLVSKNSFVEDALSELIQEFKSIKIHLVNTRHYLPQASSSSGFGLFGFGSSGAGGSGSGFGGSCPGGFCSGGSGGFSGSDPQTYHCFWCREEGHIKPNCTKRLNKDNDLGKGQGRQVVDSSSFKGPYTCNKGKAVDKTVPLHTLSNTLLLLQQHLYAQGQLNTFPTNNTYMTSASDLSPPVHSSPLAPKPHHLRPPPRELPVHISHKDVWERLKSVDASLSLADWLLLDKCASKDVKDSLRFLSGWKQKVVAPGVNMVHHQEESSDGESFYSDDWETQSLETDAANLNSNSKLNGYDSNDTVYNYHYNYKDFASS